MSRRKTDDEIRTRFWSKVSGTEDPNACWLWVPGVSRYGVFSRRKGDAMTAHRFSYMEEYGPIGEGLEIDHLCRVTRCVNPAHLEAVTRSENVRRAYAAVTEWKCRRGLHGIETSITIAASGKRRCIPCVNARRRENYANKRELVSA